MPILSTAAQAAKKSAYLKNAANVLTKKLATLVTASVFCLGMISGTAQANTVTLEDGVLGPTGTGPIGLGEHQSLGTEFDGSAGAMTFVGRVDIDNAASAAERIVGLTVGNIYFLVHPGQPGSAFRFDAVNLNTNRVEVRSHTRDIDIGYTADERPIDFSVKLTPAGSNYDFDVSIDQEGVGSFSSSFTLPRLAFGADGSIRSFGAFQVGTPGNTGTLEYTGFTASIAPVPLPAGLPLMLVALAGLGIARRKATAKP